MTLSASEVDHLKHAPAAANVLPIFLHRWSPRSFTDREVAPGDLRTIFEAARWTASSFNEQPWRFLVGRRGSPTYQKIFDSLVEFNQQWARSAPILILGATKSTFSHNSAHNPVALYDLGAAGITICYQAVALGIHTHQMAGFDRDVARRLFNIPDDFLLGAVMAMGYLGEPSAITVPSLLQQEIVPRTRKPLQEFVLSAWDQPADLE
ncbi:MAG TPA: nitroreductase family protein [Terracidiphilus sp.]|jgi:nitroreductase|nr:nitroreductase family protein [Terracidiphilus sp.]